MAYLEELVEDYIGELAEGTPPNPPDLQMCRIILLLCEERRRLRTRCEVSDLIGMMLDDCDDIKAC